MSAIVFMGKRPKKTQGATLHEKDTRTPTNLLLTAASLTALAATPPTPEVKALGVGVMQVYDYGDVKLHAYLSQDALYDVSFLLETADAVIGIEGIPFIANHDEYRQYIVGLGKPMNSILMAYHPNGAESFGDAKVYGTQEAQASQQEGGSIKVLTDGFVVAFGDSFDATMVAITTVVEPGTLTVDGVDFLITATADAYDMDIPAINSVYTHMMGSDMHSILSGTEQIDAMIAQLQDYQAKDVGLILTSHYAPKTIDAAAAKIAYLETAKALADGSDSAEAFIAAMQEAFPSYSGINYLEMSAGFLFP